ncbi:hypothetical protein [Methylopila sp. M107]|uniref:hypothetical protein n=1 Tax=Methylopila sp. M107 TaxID=1101190 RepID=UPI00035F3803|nr:hypothetical protein [Methylopila sp. M107]
MAKRAARSPAVGQGDLFAHEQLFPVRRPVDAPRSVDLSVRIKSGMGRALKECPDSASVVAARMGELSGREISADSLYAYTAPSKPEHDIGIVRFVAFVRATGAFWLYDMMVEDDGLVVLQGREARLAQLGHLAQEERRLAAARREIERELKQEPVAVVRRHRRAGDR